jgi:hypothetical protein
MHGTGTGPYAVGRNKGGRRQDWDLVQGEGTLSNRHRAGLGPLTERWFIVLLFNINFCQNTERTVVPLWR